MGHQPFSVLEDFHAQFAQIVDVEKVWAHLRKSVPPHESWVPSEGGGKRTHSLLSYPKGSAVPHDLRMNGSIYRLEKMEPFSLGANGSKKLGSGLRFVTVEIPNKNAIDVHLRMDSEVLGKRPRTSWLGSSVPPEIWGILFHPESGTAYGTVSGRIDGLIPGTRDLLIERRNLLLRFELPRLETTLLGLSPESVLSGSKLYLFSFETEGAAQVEFKP